MHKLKGLGFLELESFHSAEFSSLTKVEQYEVLQALFPDLNSNELEEMRLNILEDTELQG